MNTTTTTGRSRVRLADLAGRWRDGMRRLSDRVHQAGDAQAQALGWIITRTPGPLGLAGRTYRDPRFDLLRSPR